MINTRGHMKFIDQKNGEKFQDKYIIIQMKHIKSEKNTKQKKLPIDRENTHKGHKTSV